MNKSILAFIATAFIANISYGGECKIYNADGPKTVTTATAAACVVEAEKHLSEKKPHYVFNYTGGSYTKFEGKISSNKLKGKNSCSIHPYNSYAGTVSKSDKNTVDCLKAAEDTLGTVITALFDTTAPTTHVIVSHEYGEYMSITAELRQAKAAAAAKISDNSLKEAKREAKKTKTGKKTDSSVVK